MLIWLGKQYLGQTEKPRAEEEEEVNVEELSKQFCKVLDEAAIQYRATKGVLEFPFDTCKQETEDSYCGFNQMSWQNSNYFSQLST